MIIKTQKIKVGQSTFFLVDPNYDLPYQAELIALRVPTGYTPATMLFSINNIPMLSLVFLSQEGEVLNPSSFVRKDLFRLKTPFNDGRWLKDIPKSDRAGDFSFENEDGYLISSIASLDELNNQESQ